MSVCRWISGWEGDSEVADKHKQTHTRTHAGTQAIRESVPVLKSRRRALLLVD